ncbi:MAG: septum formation initiator family protein [Candidatus Pacebacteria bacterium]|nr:septum formation initiator family protein [Candidatus Paceibacterota bacterium]
MKSFFRKKQKNLLYSWPVLFLLFVFFLYTLYWTFGVYKKQAASLYALEETKRVWEQFKEREAGLTKDIEKLQTPRGLEEEIRERFSVAKEGEKMAIIVEDKGVNEENKEPQKNFWNWFLEIFKR